MTEATHNDPINGGAMQAITGGDAFFGQPMTAAQLINPSERLPHEAINFSDAEDFNDLYKGPSPFMAVTLERMIVGEDEWPTRVSGQRGPNFYNKCVCTI
jgi:hypothetical protein